MTRVKGDNETFNEAREEIREFNKKNPELKITIQNIRQSIRGNKRRSSHTENGLYLPKRNRDLANKYQFAD